MVDIIEVVSRAVREVLAGTDVSQAWLFGSCARGEQGMTAMSTCVSCAAPPSDTATCMRLGVGLRACSAVPSR